MRRQTPLTTQVFNTLFPCPMKDKDPITWQDHVRKNLVHEVRVEVQSFYGLSRETYSPEARFPGLSYTYPPHIRRLSKYHHHKHLFRVFNHLRLTPNEIYALCDWEGTLIVRRRYEAQNGVVLRDTTGDEIVERMEREAEVERRRRQRESQRERAGRERERWLREGVVGHNGGSGAVDAGVEQRSLEAQAEVEACRDVEMGRGVYTGAGAVQGQLSAYQELVAAGAAAGAAADEGVRLAEEEDEDEEGHLDSDDEEAEAGSTQEEPMSEIQLRRLARSISFPGAVQSIRQEAVQQMRRQGTVTSSRGGTPAVVA